ncbi:MAG: Ig-like domain-containing protein [Gemmatimonadaceae bacterium]
MRIGLPIRSLMVASALVLPSGMTIACGGGDGGAPVNPVALVASIVVSPASVAVEVGDMVQLSATALDRRGMAVAGQTFVRRSAQPSVATVPSTGLVAGVSQGNVLIIASLGSFEGQRAAVVTRRPVASVTISPATVPLEVGQSARLIASYFDADGNALGNREMSWTSNRPTVATVSTRTATACRATSASFVRITYCDHSK